MSRSKSEKLWISQPTREDVIRSIRNDLILCLGNDDLGYGKLTHREISEIVNVTQPSVTRILRHGKNASKPVPES